MDYLRLSRINQHILNMTKMKTCISLEQTEEKQEEKCVYISDFSK